MVLAHDSSDRRADACTIAAVRGDPQGILATHRPRIVSSTAPAHGHGGTCPFKDAVSAGPADGAGRSARASRQRADRPGRLIKTPLPSSSCNATKRRGGVART